MPTSTLVSRLSLALVFVGTVVVSFGFGCSPAGEAAPADLAPMPVVEPAPPVVVEPSPLLCDLDGGRWCSDCVTGQCPQGDAGWLCCSSGVCVAVAVYADCVAGICGWCKNYTETLGPDGIKTAVCFD